MPIMTYHEIADAKGITVDSARRMARKKRWAKVAGNDGLARVHVPDDEACPDARPKANPKASPSDRPGIAELVAVLDDLRRELGAERDRVGLVEAERDVERSRADAATARLAEIRERADELREDRDRWHAAAMRPWWKRLAG